ncbi:MAG: type II secretion system F family protein, partial [Bacteroidetes bacterium]|nr:type II secretion system F family protein [Bacteroidota bacterium]
VGGFLVRRFLNDERGRYWFDRRVLHLPVFGSLIIKGNVARFGLMFHILFDSGLPLIRCLDILASSIKNTAIGAEIKTMTELFRDGKDSRLATTEFEYFPELALQMITIGLESGSLGNMLSEISRHYSKEVQYTSRQLTAILEPILTVVMGAFVLLLALAIFLPMWNLIKVFKG